MVWAAHLMSTHSNGMSARQLEDQLGVTYKTAWLLTQKLRRSMVDPERDPLEGVVEVDQAEIPFREGDAFFEPSRPSRSKLGVEPLEFDAGVGGCELPIGFGVMLVSMGLPGCDLAFEG